MRQQAFEAEDMQLGKNLFPQASERLTEMYIDRYCRVG